MPEETPVTTIEILQKRIDNLENVVMRVIKQLEAHKHLPNGDAAIPLGV